MRHHDQGSKALRDHVTKPDEKAGIVARARVLFQKLNGAEFEELYDVLFSHALAEMKPIRSSFW
jgi:hypothetical protein